MGHLPNQQEVPVWQQGPAKPPKPARTPAETPDGYAVTSLAAAVASLGFLVGPAMLLAFGWAFAAIAVVTGTCSRSGRGIAAVGLVLGLLVALGTIVVAVG